MFRFKKKINENTTEQVFGEKLSFSAKESYNLLRTNLTFALAAKNGNVIGITSSCAQEGKSYTSVNLAYSFAKAEKTVLVIEADMRKGVLSKALGKDNKNGLSELLSSQAEDVVTAGVLHKNISVIFAGTTPPNPSELLGSPKMEEVLKTYSKQYDLVIVDLPPVLAVSDALAVSKYLTGMVVVVRHTVTQKKDLMETTRLLDFAKVDTLGFVYNDYSDMGVGYSKKKYYKKYYKKKHYYQNYQNEEENKNESAKN